MAVENGTLLRKYLLGMLKDENAVREIEEQLLTGEEFADHVAAVEHELIENFLDGDLDEVESQHFVGHFLRSPQRRDQLDLIRDLRGMAAKGRSEIQSPTLPDRGRWASTRPYLVGAAFAFAAVAVVCVWWMIQSRTSDLESGLANLREAYKEGRPVRPRVTVLEAYQPYTELRGTDHSRVDGRAKERAERHLLDANQNEPGAKAHHALGVYYLFEKDLAKAKEELLLASDAVPKNARIESDTGALFLEIANEAAERGEGAARLTALDLCLNHSEASLALDPSVHEARFNRALCLQELGHNERAMEAWEQYLDADPDSQWATEARQNLERLKGAAATEISAAELEAAFLDAFRRGDAFSAGGLIGPNRDLIRQRYIPLRLAARFASASPAERYELSGPLRFAGEVEEKSSGDRFARQMADFYLHASPNTLESARRGHELLQTAIQQLVRQDFASAAGNSRSARTSFDAAGDLYTANVAKYFFAYALLNTNRNEDGMRLLQEVCAFARSGNFRWLNATALYWVGGGFVKAGRYSKAVTAFKEGAEEAEAIGDSFLRQRHHLELSNRHAFAGQYRTALDELSRAVDESSKPGGSPRQRYRTLSDAASTLSSVKLLDAARSAALEAAAQSDRIGDPVWRSQSRAIAAINDAVKGDFEAARGHLDVAREVAESIKDRHARDGAVAFTDLRTGDVRALLGDHETAAAHYVKALSYYTEVNMPMSREEARRGLLLCLSEIGNDEELGRLIPVAIEALETYRAGIAEESQRYTYLGARSNVYDIATDFEYRRGNIEAAFNYSERSNSRSLLDWMKRGSSASGPDDAPLILNGDAAPAHINEILESMPSGSQVLQYSVLEKRVLIWIISERGLVVREAAISSAALEDMVVRFRSAVLARKGLDQPELSNLGRQLYGLLIEPVRPELDPRIELCIVPSKSLFKLPFAALISPDDRVLLEEYELLFAPSANAFIHSSELASDRSNATVESVLAVGNAEFRRDQFGDLAFLPDSETEVRSISARYPKSNVLLRKAAKKSTFLALLPKSEVVHFAGHYVTSPGSPYSSYLLLAQDGPDREKSILTNRELARIKLPKAKLVVLAACSTGIGELDANEGITTIARMMLAVESPLVIGTQWPVDSESTGAVMSRFHELRKTNALASTASLRLAQLELFNEPTGRFGAPYYWAAFAGFGGHASF